MPMILLKLQPERCHLAEYLADLGYDICQSEWGAPPQSPAVVIVDSPWVQVMDGPLADDMLDGSIGIIGIGDAKPADISLPSDVHGRELAMAVQLVGEISRLRRKQQVDHRERERWIELALHDPLTGLPNRRSWEQELDRRLADHGPLGVSLVDVDYFKQVNDHGGHDVGDDVLREVATSMRLNLRGEDFVARMGGDEFSLLISGVDRRAVESIIERLRKAVSRHLRDRGLPAPTLSAGIVFADRQQARQADALYAAAARSLHEAKSKNRNCTVACVLQERQRSVS